MTTGTADANGITIAYETFGRRDNPSMVLVMGLGVQMIAWADEFCEALAGRGFFVVRFDNRDAGLSTHFPDAPRPDLLGALMTGDTSSAAYLLSDMADDTVGLMDALGIDQAHLVGASMGGMIAQTVAIEHPERVVSLTSIMSTPSPVDGSPTDSAISALLTIPATTRDEAIEQSLATFAVIGSPGYDRDEAWLRDVAGRSYDRDHDPDGVARQLMAIVASGDRKPALAGVAVPTLVIHGDADPLVRPDGGEATAKAVPGAELVIFPGMGHSLPRELWEPIVDRIEAVARRADPGNPGATAPNAP